jgi:hypothetical protein
MRYEAGGARGRQDEESGGDRGLRSGTGAGQVRGSGSSGATRRGASRPGTRSIGPAARGSALVKLWSLAGCGS